MTLTISDLRAKLAQYPADMPVAVSYLAGHEGLGSAGVYQTVDNLLDTSQVETKTLVVDGQTQKYLTVSPTGYVDEWFETTDDTGVYPNEMTLSELAERFDGMLIDPDAVLTEESLQEKLTDLHAVLQTLTVELVGAEHELLTSQTPDSLTRYRRLAHRKEDVLTQIKQTNANLAKF